MAKTSRSKLGTAREVEALAAAADFCESQGLPLARDLRSLHAKLTAKPKTEGADAAGLERALVAASDGRVVPTPVPGRGFWARLSRRYGDMGATVEQAELVGRWLATQHWASGKQYTLDSLAKWWPTFLARAQAAPKETGGVEWKRPDWDPDTC